MQVCVRLYCLFLSVPTYSLMRGMFQALAVVLRVYVCVFVWPCVWEETLIMMEWNRAPGEMDQPTVCLFVSCVCVCVCISVEGLGQLSQSMKPYAAQHINEMYNWSN